jgi:hypothetical protein
MFELFTYTKMRSKRIDDTQGRGQSKEWKAKNLPTRQEFRCIERNEFDNGVKNEVK